jgi:hypothetical protein
MDSSLRACTNNIKQGVDGMNKKILLLIIITCFVCAGFTKAAQPKNIVKDAHATGLTNSPASSEELKAVLMKFTKEQTTFFKSFSIGKNQNAAFAIVKGNVWYVTKSGAKTLLEDSVITADNVYQRPFLWKVGTTEIFKCENAPGGSSSISYAWYLKNGKPVQLPYVGMDLRYTGNGQFMTIGESFDMNFTDGLGTGHTYKRYYLYWSKDGFKEYGGLRISKQQLLKVKGSKEIIDVIVKSGHIVDEIYYRNNNTININYHTGNKRNGNFDNVTLLLKNNSAIPQLINIDKNISKAESFDASNMSDFSYGGIYRSAFFTRIATYPVKFLEKAMVREWKARLK